MNGKILSHLHIGYALDEHSEDFHCEKSPYIFTKSYELVLTRARPMSFLISCATDPLFLLCHHCLLVCNGVAEDGNSLAKSKNEKNVSIFFYSIFDEYF